MRGNQGFWHSHDCTKDRYDAAVAVVGTAWLAVWLGRVLQEQVDFLKAENRLLRETLCEVTDGTEKVVRRDRLGGVLGFYYREAA